MQQQFVIPNMHYDNSFYADYCNSYLSEHYPNNWITGFCNKVEQQNTTEEHNNLTEREMILNFLTENGFEWRKSKNPNAVLIDSKTHIKPQTILVKLELSGTCLKCHFNGGKNGEWYTYSAETFLDRFGDKEVISAQTSVPFLVKPKKVFKTKAIKPLVSKSKASKPKAKAKPKVIK